jgi:tetratricopeptide (TPR) repeat protein
MHRRAADAIVSTNQGREEAVAATVTMHLEKSGAEPTRIAYYAELAGNSAYIVSAYAEATLHYRKAVSYLEQKLSPEQLPALIALLERLAECTLNSGGDYAEARDIFQRVLDLRRNHLSPAADQQSEAQNQALLWEQMSWTWRYVADIRRAWECWSQGEALLRSAGVVGGPVWARLYYTQSNLYRYEGLYVQALESAQQAISLIDTEQASSPVQVSAGQKICKTLFQRIIEGYPDLYGRLQRHMGSIAVAMGQLSQALAYQNLALKFFEQYTELRQIAHVSCNIGYIHLKMAEYSQAQAALRRALHLAESIGDRPLLSLVQSNLGELEAAVGNLGEAEVQYTNALKLNSLLNDREYMSKWNAGLASVYLEQGAVQKATKCMEQAFFVARSIQNAPCIGQALVALGNIRITQALDTATPVHKHARLLAHAQQDIKRALRLEVEAETRMKGELALAHIAYIRGEQHDARTAFEQVIVEALNSEHLQIVGQARQLLAQV